MNNSDLKKIEFWIATGLYILLLLTLLLSVDNRHDYRFSSYAFDFRDAGLTFRYLEYYFIPRLTNTSILYFSFLILNFYLVPAIFKKTNLVYHLMLGILLFGLVGLFNGIILTYSHAYLLVTFKDLNHAYYYLFLKGYINATLLFLFIILYVAVKTYFPLLFKTLALRFKNPRVLQECAIAFVVWIFVLILLGTQVQKDDFAVAWAMLVPIGILQYGLSLHLLIPSLKAKGIKFGGYLWRSLLIITLSALPLAFLFLLIYRDEAAFFIPALGNIALHGFLTTPICWLIYNYRSKNTSEISFLKKELGKSDANLSFLQSQINPHFLFNALNTLYGTALQENAERTGEGIQKLGDMMRFMLHENVQDKILLTRDVDYLENYIALQKLRTSKSAAIIIETQIEDQLNNFQITPMLLIPFVENAFKHGISLQHPSHIKITLQTRGNTLYFDVHNSIHIKPDHDPEKMKSGIGLQNVKQRLALLYPGKHDLIIRESATEFFIHLTLEL